MSYASDALIDAQKREIEQLKAENEKLRSERDHWHVEQVHAYGNWEDVHKYAAKLEAENAKLEKRLAQYELFREVVGDPAHEFASLRRELHRAERENAELVKRNEELQADVIRLFLDEVRKWIDCKQREMEAE